MAARRKVTITIDPELLAAVRAVVDDGGARSISSFIEHSVAGQLASETDFDLVIEEILEQTGGPLRDGERLAAQRLLTQPAS